MFRLFAPLLAAFLCLAQAPPDPSAAPPDDVDRSLRARITEFYQDLVDSKFRQAEALVAEETRDFYYASNKPKLVGFEITKIDYTERFTRAKVLTNCEQYLPQPEFASKPIKIATPSYWKLVDGQWYWYIDPEAARQTPFGKININPSSAAPGSTPPVIPRAADVLRNLKKQVSADKAAVSLKAGESDQVTISNNAPGTVSISLHGNVPGVDVKLDRMNMKTGEKATLTFRAGSTAKPGSVSILVEQTNQVIPIQVSVN